MRAYIHPTSIVDDGVLIGKDVQIWHFCHLMSGCKVGDSCNFGQNVFIDVDVHLGKGVRVQNNVSIYKGVIIEDDVFIGPSVVFTNVLNPRSFISRKNEFKSTLVHRGATIGANATIVCGTEIGEFALVGAGSVVTRNVLAFELVFGNPARHMGWVSKAGSRLNFQKDNIIAECPQMRDKYKLIEGRLIRLTPDDVG